MSVGLFHCGYWIPGRNNVREELFLVFHCMVEKIHFWLLRKDLIVKEHGEAEPFELLQQESRGRWCSHFLASSFLPLIPPDLPAHVTALLTFNVNLLLISFPLGKTFLNIRSFTNLFGPFQNHQVHHHTRRYYKALAVNWISGSGYPGTWMLEERIVQIILKLHLGYYSPDILMVIYKKFMPNDFHSCAMAPIEIYY